MRDRLIELFKEMDKNPEITCPNPTADGEACKGCKYAISEWLCNIEARKADYLLANGVIVPPCKVGDTVYVLNVPRYGNAHSINRATVVGFHLGDFGKLHGHKRKDYLSVAYDTFPHITHIPLDKSGKTVFLTKEEEVQELKERERK